MPFQERDFVIDSVVEGNTWLFESYEQNKVIFSTEIFYARYGGVLMNDVVSETSFKPNYLDVMSNSNNKRKELSTKDDKLIESNLFLMQDNDIVSW